MRKARGHTLPQRVIVLPQLVSVWFQVLLTPLEGVLFIVQSPYWFTIGRDVVLSLGEWAPQLPTGLACPVVLRNSAGVGRLSLTGLAPSMVGFSTPFC